MEALRQEKENMERELRDVENRIRRLEEDKQVIGQNMQQANAQLQ